MPKPRKTHDYCGICHQLFKEYSEHINLQSHKDNYTNNEKIKNSLNFTQLDENHQKIQEILINNINFNINVKVSFDKKENLVKNENFTNSKRKSIKPLEYQRTSKISIKKRKPVEETSNYMYIFYMRYIKIDIL